MLSRSMPALGISPRAMNSSTRAKVMKVCTATNHATTNGMHHVQRTLINRIADNIITRLVELNVLAVAGSFYTLTLL